jgi:hypothetical protein
MSCSVDWNTHIITIPKTYLTLVSGTLYELNTNQLRLDLKALEVTVPGIVHPITHRHNTEVTIAGTTYARTIEILPPYSFEFEDGQYSVRLVGSNNNLFDVENGVLVQNQVQIIVTNSAGLITTSGGTANPVTSYNNIIVIDVINGNPGGAIPNGTMDSPVNNIGDALTLSSVTGIKTFYVIGNIEVGGYNLTGITFIGNDLNTLITILNTDTSSNITIKNCQLTGVINDGIFAHNCLIHSLDNVNGFFFDCSLQNNIVTLGNNKETQFINCSGKGTPTINMGGLGQTLNVNNYNGMLKISNKKDIDTAIISFNVGELKLANDVIKGRILVKGIGEIVQDLSKGVEVVDQLVNKDYAASYITPGGVIRKSQ